MDEQKRHEEPTKDAELKRPEEEIEDLEPEERDRENVAGGDTGRQFKYLDG